MLRALIALIAWISIDRMLGNLRPSHDWQKQGRSLERESVHPGRLELSGKGKGIGITSFLFASIRFGCIGLRDRERIFVLIRFRILA